ncbi:MAG: hypothetical protein JW754_03555 [Candidatus Aenigmarchaeota archaeon]|nr:hypothetical protein [Candidatus Aenigmarchaeota archaeon]
MATMMDILATFFKISPELVSKYAYQGPIYQIFYLLFFPTLFILLFIYILTSRGPIGLHRGFKVLVSIAVYAFIILNGWYNYFVMVSEFWLFLLVLMGVVYFFWARGGTKGGVIGKQQDGGGQVAGRSVFSGLGGQLANRIKMGATKEIKDTETLLDSLLDALSNLVTQYKNASGSAADRDNIVRAWGEIYVKAQTSVQDYRRMLEVGGFAVGRTKYDHYLKQIKRIVNEWEKLQK